MDQSVALNALAPYLALAPSATSPRAAADLITQATSAPNTYIFAELLHHSNIQSLRNNEQYGSHLQLLEIFAWGTYQDYKSNPSLPTLTDAQTLKLRLLTLLTLASHPTKPAHLTYPSLQSSLDLTSPLDLEHLTTQAIYSNLLTGTLNPSTQTITITSLSPLRDLAPGSIATMTQKLAAWSTRCDSALQELELEMGRVRAEAARRAMLERRMEKQVKAVTEAAEKAGGKGSGKRGGGEDDGEWDGMELDGGGFGVIGGGKKKGGGSGGAGGAGGAGAMGSFMDRFRGR